MAVNYENPLIAGNCAYLHCISEKLLHSNKTKGKAGRGENSNHWLFSNLDWMRV